MEQKELFQFSEDNALEIIMGISLDGRISYANQLAMEQLEYGDELYGTNITEIFPELFQVEDNQLIYDTRKYGVLREVMAYRFNRTCFPARMKFFEAPGFVGDAAYICLAYDISNESFLEKRIVLAGQ